MILLYGIPSETSLRMVHDEIAELGIPCALVNQRRIAQTAIDARVTDGRVVGTLTVGDEDYDLAGITAVLPRPMDVSFLPEVADLPPDAPLRRHASQVQTDMHRWLEMTDALVLNRPCAMSSNGSKPFQAQLIRAAGFSVPDTLVTNDPEAALAFRERHGRIIYKSISSMRSIVHCLEDGDLDRLERIRWCPVQFQEHIDGYDLRVHVVEEKTFATAIRSDYSDYRYAGRDTGAPAELVATELEDDLAQRCVDLAAALELTFAGIDLRITAEGRQVCFEVNPSPAFSYYESHTGQPIAAAVAQCLARPGMQEGSVGATATPDASRTRSAVST